MRRSIVKVPDTATHPVRTRSRVAVFSEHCDGKTFKMALVVLAVLALLLCATAAAEEAEPVTFERDVMSVLSKAGCNAGTCHGNLNGKGGFFLSLRGEHPTHDYDQLVRSFSGRRINRVTPEKSLILLKATAQVPHQGGKRFEAGSPEYRILTGWIEQGMPAHDPEAPLVTRLEVTPDDAVLWEPENELQLDVTAHFDDGSSRNVTRLAVYEPSDPRVRVSEEGRVRFPEPGVSTVLVRYLDGQFPVRLAARPEQPEFTWSDPPRENFIDEAILSRLEQLKINPAPVADDHVFLRRVFLDLLGILPTAEEARAFVADDSDHKRERLVDQLLDRPEFAATWALKWSDLVRNEEKTLDAKGVELLHAWMRKSFEEDKPLNQFARELIGSRGSTYENPPANFWRAHREPFVRAETTAQVFLGIRLQCAKCHNHPFDQWLQDEYYEWSALFTGIDYEIVKNERKDRLDKHEFVGEQIVLIRDRRGDEQTMTGQEKGQDDKAKEKKDKDKEPEIIRDVDVVKNARTGEPAPPRFLGGADAVEGDRLERLASWISGPGNRMFARAQANRIWYHVTGRGLVEPVDDLRLTNPASHPDLLERLTDELIESNFSVKHVVRTIVLSRTYHLASEFEEPTIEEHQYDEQLYARAVIRRLSAEQLLDAQAHVLGVPAKFEGYPEGTRAGEVAGVERVRRKLDDGDRFLRLFGKPERLLACECERSEEPTLGQALSLVGGAGLHERLKKKGNRIDQLLSGEASHEQAVEDLFWTALTRPPTERERARALELIQDSGDARRVLEDLTWALLNAKELIFRN